MGTVRETGECPAKTLQTLVPADIGVVGHGTKIAGRAFIGSSKFSGILSSHALKPGKTACPAARPHPLGRRADRFHRWLPKNDRSLAARCGSLFGEALPAAFWQNKSGGDPRPFCFSLLLHRSGYENQLTADWFPLRSLAARSRPTTVWRAEATDSSDSTASRNSSIPKTKARTGRAAVTVAEAA